MALYLINFDEPFEIFFPDRKDEWDDIYYVANLQLFFTLIHNGITYYD